MKFSIGDIHYLCVEDEKDLICLDLILCITAEHTYNLSIVLNDYHKCMQINVSRLTHEYVLNAHALKSLIKL